MNKISSEQHINNPFCQLLGIEKPLLMAPMFLVSNAKMLKLAMKNGIAGAIPSLNFRDDSLFNDTLSELKTHQKGTKGCYGVNLIVKNNPKYEAHLKIIEENKVPLVITSLGDPTEVIDTVRTYGGKVLCDVTSLKHAEKASQSDGFIAVGQGAGGHAGNISLQVLIPMLRQNFPDKVILGAGGLANFDIFNSILTLGADGASAGTIFIAAKESPVSKSYKQAVIQAKASDIVMSRILSGTPSTLIKSDYLLKLEKQLKTRKLSLNRGVQLLRDSGIDADYQKLFVAGQAVEFINEQLSVSDIIKKIVG